MSARILDVTQAEYFADPCEVPSLSQSIAKTLLAKSPLHAWTEHPKLGGIKRPETKAKDDGSIIHAIMLGTPGDLDVLNFDDYRTKAAQELRDAAYAAGRTPVIERKYQEFLTIAGTLRTNIDRKLAKLGVAMNGKSEVAFEWTESGFHGDILCRGKMDHVVLDEGRIFDLKKITSADPETCERHVDDYGYDIQDAAYRSALAKYRPELAGRVDFIFVFFELTPPFDVYPCRADGTLRAIGESKWARAQAIWERCLHHDDWPGYTDSIGTLRAKPWAITQEEMLNASV